MYSVGDILPFGKNKTVYINSSSSNAVRTDYSKPIPNFKIKGESFYATKNEEKRLLRTYMATFVFSEDGENYRSEYYYTPLIHNCVIIKGKKINIHVVKKNDVIKIGTPFIFEGY